MDPRPAREAITTALGSIPALRVWSWPHVPDQPTTATAVLAVTAVRPADVACPHARTDVDVWLFTAATTDAPAYDDLDDALSSALSALTAAALTWTEATAGVWNGTHPAYRIAVEVYA